MPGISKAKSGTEVKNVSEQLVPMCPGLTYLVTSEACERVGLVYKDLPRSNKAYAWTRNATVKERLSELKMVAWISVPSFTSSPNPSEIRIKLFCLFLA